MSRIRRFFAAIALCLALLTAVMAEGTDLSAGTYLADVTLSGGYDGNEPAA